MLQTVLNNGTVLLFNRSCRAPETDNESVSDEVPKTPTRTQSTDLEDEYEHEPGGQYVPVERGRRIRLRVIRTVPVVQIPATWRTYTSNPNTNHSLKQTQHTGPQRTYATNNSNKLILPKFLK